MSARATVAVTALLLLSGCAAVPLSTQLQSFGASVTFSAAGTSTARDRTSDERGTLICVSERCVASREKRRSKHPLRLQLSFYSPNVTDDAAQR